VNLFLVFDPDPSSPSFLVKKGENMAKYAIKILMVLLVIVGIIIAINYLLIR